MAEPIREQTSQKKELRERVESRKKELEARLEELKADTRSEVRKEEQDIRARLASLKETLANGWDDFSEAVARKLNTWLDKS